MDKNITRERIMGIYIRERKLKLYLDIYHNRKRWWEKIGLTITGEKKEDKEIMRPAEEIRRQREKELCAAGWNIQNPAVLRTTLAGCLEEMAKLKAPNNQYITGCIRLLKEYPGGPAIRLVQITPNG
jgi:hypothetical protein